MYQFPTTQATRCAEPQCFPDQKTLEDWLMALTEDEIARIHELLTSKLSKSPSKQMKGRQDIREIMNLQRLTAREQEVLTLVASGYTRAQVAEVLKITRNTAASHIANIYRKLEIESIAEATLLAFRSGFIA